MLVLIRRLGAEIVFANNIRVRVVAVQGNQVRDSAMKMLCFSLILLVLLTPLDDALARATPEVDDDILATQNDQFLAKTANQTKPLQRELPPAPGRFSAQATIRPPASLSRPWRTEARLAVLFGPELLYALMSLQR
jgi:hypothetical protein